MSAFPPVATLTGVTALGTSASTAYVIPAKVGYVQVSTCTNSAYAVKLPQSQTGVELIVANDGASALSVFPPVVGSASGTIDALSAGTAAVVQPGARINLVCRDGWAWGTKGFQAPINVANGFSNPPILTIAATGTTALTAASPQRIVIPTLSGNATVTLPAVAAGLTYDFRFAAAESHTLTITATAAVMQGSGIVATGTAASNACVPISAKTNLIYTAAAVGDSVGMWSDGTNWYVQAVSSAATISVS